VLRRIFGPKSYEITESCRKLYNEELHYLYSLPNITRIIKSRKTRWARHVAGMRKRNVHKVLVGKPEGKGPLGIPSLRWLDIEMDRRGIEWSGMDQINLAQDRDQLQALVSTVIYLRVP
jgi:hypothetical protein